MIEKANINPEELFICVGDTAHEKFTGEKLNPNRQRIYPNELSAGVCVEHIPTGKMAYSKTERSQYKNRDKALLELSELLK